MTTNKNNNERYRNQQRADMLNDFREVLEEIQEGPAYREEIFPDDIVAAINNLYEMVCYALRNEIAKPYNPDDVAAEYKAIRGTLADIRHSMDILDDRISATKTRLDRADAATEEINGRNEDALKEKINPIPWEE